jgi:FtsZ-binding cell division protein ZapB
MSSANQSMYEDDAVTFDNLEERVLKVVELVNSLRKEKEALASELAAAKAEAQRYHQELEALRSERKQVRTRIEKLLGQMDLLSNQ